MCAWLSCARDRQLQPSSTCLLVTRQAQEAAKAGKPRTAEEYEAAISELNLRVTDLEAGKAKEEEARNYMQLERVRHLPLN